MDRDESVKIDHRDFALKMLQRIRDEAHRFAITYFRNLHSKRNLESVLSEIEGVGKKKRIALMNKFGTIDRIMGASVEELSSVEGIGEVLAKNIKDYLKKSYEESKMRSDSFRLRRYASHHKTDNSRRG